MALQRMKDVTSPQYMVAWLSQDIKEIEEAFGGNPWPHGVDANCLTCRR